MAIGISLNVGLDNVTSDIYEAPQLFGAENDAQAMHDVIAKSMGFDMALSEVLLGVAATHEAVELKVSKAAEILKPGDLFLFSFAGHGTFQMAPEGSEETDDHDESIVLTDHFMMDDFWRNTLWPKFAEGVRIVAVADCCHSETVIFESAPESLVHVEAESVAVWADGVSRASASFTSVGVAERVDPKIPSRRPEVAPRFRLVTAAERDKELAGSKEFYDTVLADSPKPIKARLLFLSACTDGQKAADGDQHGAFTAQLLKVWQAGDFDNYLQFMEQIRAPFDLNKQKPTLTPFQAQNLELEQPFKIQ